MKKLQPDFPIPETFNMTSYILEDNIAKGRGNKVAIIHDDKRYTYKDMVALCNKIGNVLKKHDVEIEDRVLLILQDSPEWVAGFFGTIKIGAVATWAYTYLQPKGYADIIDLVRPKAIIADETTIDRVREGIELTRFSPVLLVKSESDIPLGSKEFNLTKQMARASKFLETEPTSKDDVAMWLFSGGTTGVPKAVPHLHRDCVICAESLMYVTKYSEKDTVLNVPKLFFHYARINGLDAPLRAGATVILFSERTKAELIFELVDKYKPTVLLNVPTMMRAMIQVPEEQRKSLKSLRFIFSSGEALSGELYNNWMETFNIPVADILGSAESGAPYLGNKPGKKVPGSLGKILPFVELKLVDKKGNEVPNGKIGTLLVHTDTAGLCYVRLHEKSKETFLGDDWVNTGDLLKKDKDGNYWYVGRGNEMVKVSGVWVSLLEIQNCLAKHNAVHECVVLGIKDSDGLTKTKAFVALKAGNTASKEMDTELKEYCKQKLASYKAPRTIQFMDEIPKTEAGKTDKRKLASMGL